MPKDLSAIDELIDSGKLEEVYKAVRCKNSKHDPNEVKVTKSPEYIRSVCSGCPAFRIEKKEREIKPRDFPPGTPIPLGVIGDETIYHCRVGDYISSRKELKSF
jgi:hypothetical protein